MGMMTSHRNEMEHHVFTSSTSVKYPGFLDLSTSIEHQSLCEWIRIHVHRVPLGLQNGLHQNMHGSNRKLDIPIKNKLNMEVLHNGKIITHG